MSARTAHDRGVMVGRVIVLGLAIALWSGCDCEPKRASLGAGTPEGFDAGHERTRRTVDRRAKRPDSRRARSRAAGDAQAHVLHGTRSLPGAGRRSTRGSPKELATQVREASDYEEACMAFARLSYACGQCHHALDRGPPIKLEPAPAGEDLKMHMRRHYWAVERMWEALLSDSPRRLSDGRRNAGRSPLFTGQRIRIARAIRVRPALATRCTTWRSPPRSRGRCTKTNTCRSPGSPSRKSRPAAVRPRSSGASCRHATSATP